MTCFYKKIISHTNTQQFYSKPSENVLVIMQFHTKNPTFNMDNKDRPWKSWSYTPNYFTLAKCYGILNNLLFFI